MRMSPFALCLGMAALAGVIAAGPVWAQSASQLTSGVPAPVKTQRPGQKPVPAAQDGQARDTTARDAPAKDASAKDAAPAAKCGRFDAARNAIYAAVIKTVLSELPDQSKAGDMAAFQGEMEQIYQKYEVLAKTGDVQALRKLLAIEMFVSQIRRKDATELSLRKACALGKVPEKQRMIADALSCAVMSLEGERREDETSRERAKTMLANAKAVIPESANASSPGKILYEDVARGLDGCY